MESFVECSLDNELDNYFSQFQEISMIVIIQSISNFNFSVLLPFGIGMLTALALMPKLINKVYEKYGKSILVFFGGLILATGINGILLTVN